MAVICRWDHLTNPNYKQVLQEVKEALGSRYNYNIARGIAETYSGTINDITSDYILQQWPQPEAFEEKNLSSQPEEAKNTSGIIKIISGGQTGVDTIGLQVAKSLGIETGGKAPKGFKREENIDTENIASYGLTEITDAEQSDYTSRKHKSDPYTGRTELNVRNSDGTVYFFDSQDKAGYIATKRAAEEWKKPILVNPSARELREWIDTNGIKVLNVAGNRGSKLQDSQKVSNTIKEALTMNPEEVPLSSEDKKIIARRKAKQEKRQAARWDQYAHGRKAFEVSSVGDELGKQFSALSAVFPEGTTITIKGKRKGEEETFDIGGYSIEAAYQLIKGYNGNPKGSLLNKEGKVIAKIEGKGKAPISKILRIAMPHKPTSADRRAAEDYSYNNAYLPLWKLWRKLNPETFDKLKKEVKKQKIEVLTDKFADTAVSQARALSEMLWGTPKNPVNEKMQTKYDIQRENAVEASKQIPKDVKKIKKFSGVKIVGRASKTDQQIAWMANGKNNRGQDTTNKSMILSYKLEDDAAMSEVVHDFSNPFEGQRGAVAKFIQWIMPNDFASLPDELRIEEGKRNIIRTYLSKGGYTKTDILGNGDPENTTFVKTLRYIIDNFQELRQRYNPIDIVDFGEFKQRIKIQAAQGQEAGANNTLYFAPKESISDGEILDDNNAIKLERQSNADGTTTNNLFLSFPAEYNKKFSKVQKQRLFKTIAMSLREGEILVFNPDIADDEMVEDFNTIVSRGFKQIDEKAITMLDGSQQNVGVYRRNGFKKPQVETHEPFVIRGSIEDVFQQINDEYEEGKIYAVEMSEAATDDYDYKIWEKHPVVPLYTTHSSDWTHQARWDDEQFPQFKAHIDRAFEYMHKKIDEGYTIVLPSGEIGSGRAAMQNYAPKCFEYLQQQLDSLKEHGNREALANKYFAEATATVDPVDASPSEHIDLDPRALQSPRAQLRQRFTDRQLSDLSRLYARKFLALIDKNTERLIKELSEQLAAESDKKKIEKLKRRLNKLSDPMSSQMATLDEIGVEELLRQTTDAIIATSKLPGRTQEQSQVLVDSTDSGFSPLIFGYAIPIIENLSGIRIKQSQLTAGRQQTTEQKNDAAEDTSGEDNPEMGWSYNHRLVDPSKSLSRSVRNIIGNIFVRDLNAKDKVAYVFDSIGEIQTYDAGFIYSAIMSRMSNMSLGEIDNFIVITPPELLSEKDRANYPLGKPSFPVLESMKTRYPWANDIISKLSSAYRTGGRGLGGYNTKRFGKLDPQAVVENPITVAEVGNICSQFHSNFCQQFVSYATMVNGAIVDENKPTGSVSISKAAVANYNGNIRFPGIAMIYNADGSINAENLKKALDKLSDVYDTIYEETTATANLKKKERPFWDAVNRVKSENTAGSIIDMYEQLPTEVKQSLQDLSDVMKAAGIVFPVFDLWGMVYEGKNPNISEMIGELGNALRSLEGLPDNEHMYESSYNLSRGIKQAQKGKYHKYDSPKTAWSHFFNKFGDYVTEQEMESSPRILGKVRYSYTYPSYMSVTLANLTNMNFAARKKFIEENYMPYEWFYDKQKGKFKNTMLESLYNNEDSVALGTGHDMLSIKDGYYEKEYSEWTPEDISRLMFRELIYPNNPKAGNFIIPVLSDSRICKVIKASKDVGDAMNGMVNVVLQELERMNLVDKRSIILRMQDIDDKLSDNQPLSDDEKKYWEGNQEFYQKYRNQHIENLEEIENFDKNGTKFCFFPELNNIKFSIRIAAYNKDDLMHRVILLLSKDPNNPSQNEVSLKDVLRAIQNMSDENYNRKVAQVGLSERKYGDYTDENGASQFGEYYVAASKEYLIQNIIESVLTQVLDSKVRDFLYNRWGGMNEDVRSGILHADKDLMDRWNKRPVASEEHPLTPEQEEELKNLNLAIYNKARDFYYAHTGAMSQFLQLMVTDLAYYKDPTTFKGSVDFAKRFKEVYGAGMKMNTNSKFGKKIEGNIIIKDKIRRSRSWKTLESVLDKAVEEGRIDSVEKDAVLEKFKGVNGTDAQAFRSLTSWRDIMDMIGRNSYELAEAIENLRNGKFTMADFYTIFNTIKPFSYGPEDMDSGIEDTRLRTMVQHKNSEAVLLAIYNTLVGSDENDDNYSPTLRGLNRAMEEIKLVDENGQVMKYANGEEMRAIDVAQYQSAVKVGAQGIIDINYSRDKLKDAQDKCKIAGFSNEALEKWLKNNKDSGKKVTYYEIEKKLSDLLDKDKISIDEYEKAMDFFEPNEQEVFDIIKNSIYKDPNNESLGYNDQVLHKIPYKYYCIQQPTPDHFTDNKEATFGSQPRHIILSDLPADFKITINGITYDRDGIRRRYNGLLVANLLDCYEKEIEPLFKDTGEVNKKGKKKTSLEKLRDRLMPIVESNPKYSQLADALEIIPDGKGGETFALPLNNLTIAAQLEEVMTSLFKNAIHRQTINGGNVILAADVGYSKQLKIRGERDENGKLIPGKIEGIECFLPASSRKMFEPFMTDSKGNPYGTTDAKKLEGVERDKEGNIIYKLDPKKLKDSGLDKIIGYRIPTEGLYSIMPLIVKGFLPQQSGSSIVVAQEVTTLTGSDNDVDKMFLMIKAVDTKKWREIKHPKVNTDSKEAPHPLEMTKSQRDNEIIDIFYGITTSEQMSHRWLHPGNFDNIIIAAKRNRILKTKKLRDAFIRNAGFGRVEKNGRIISETDQLITALSEELRPSQYNELYRRVMELPADKKFDKDKTLMDIVVDFTDKYVDPLSPVYPDTFTKMHQIYMAGVAEKGIFANNRLDNAKLQWANVTISPAYTFSFEGREVKKIDEITVTRKRGGKTYQHYISDDCAECSAAAVDNGKTPTLGDLNSNTQTATFFGFLTRLGLGIDGAALLLSQPAVDRSINTSGGINPKTLRGDQKKMATWLKQKGYDLQDDRFNWRMHDFNTREWYKNITDAYNLDNLLSKGGEKDIVERVASLYRTYDLILNLAAINSELQDPRTVLHYDSPNHAADTSIGGVVEQTKVVQEVNKRKELPEHQRMLRGDDQLVVYELEKKIREKEKQEEKKGKKKGGKEILKKASSKYRLFNALMDTEMPITQSFYTLGIEKVRSEMAPQFVFGREELQRFTDRLYDYMNNMGIRKPADRRRIISQAYKDWVVFRLSGTKLFGDDETMTFDQKRQYYLYQYPAIFMKLKEEIPELQQIDATRRMFVDGNIIKLNREGSTPLSVRNFITDSFDTLLQSTNKKVQKVAKDLLLYTYYLNGFEFSYMSYGNFLGTEFQRAFPEYIQALNNMNIETISDDMLDNFFDQFTVKRNKTGLLPSIEYENSQKRSEAAQKGYHDTGRTVDWYGSVEEIPMYVTNVTIVKNTAQTEILKYNHERSQFYGTVIYEPLPTNTSLHYNANQTMEEMGEVIYDHNIIDASRKVGKKRRNRDVVRQDSHQATKDNRETSNSRDENVDESTGSLLPKMAPEESNPDLGNTQAATAFRESNDDVEMDDNVLSRAAGEESNFEAEKVLDEYDKMAGRTRDQKEAPDDPDIAEAQNIIKENNDGREACLTK